MGLWSWLRGKKPSATDRAAFGRKEMISHCRYFRCTNCGAVYAKDVILSNWQATLMLAGSGTAAVSGTRTCKCGKVMQVQDIYDGVHDVPRKYWSQLQGPVEVD
jgi:hypothetical protein